jgi:4a-hydroxytetrahydrobiopterin dehydratase
MSETKVAPLTSRTCVPCEGGVEPLKAGRVKELLKQLDGWDAREGEIAKLYRFRDFAGALAFANAVGFMAEREGHHPDLEVSWGSCKVRYSTHAIGGLSENDFICAAKADALAKL